MAKFSIEATCIYNGYAEIEAESLEEAKRIAGESLNYDGLKDFPSEVETPIIHFSFGEATIDYAEEITE